MCGLRRVAQASCSLTTPGRCPLVQAGSEFARKKANFSEGWPRERCSAKRRGPQGVPWLAQHELHMDTHTHEVVQLPLASSRSLQRAARAGNTLYGHIRCSLGYRAAPGREAQGAKWSRPSTAAFATGAQRLPLPPHVGGLARACCPEAALAALEPQNLAASFLLSVAQWRQVAASCGDNSSR